MQDKTSPRAKASFTWDDPFHLDNQLNEEERLIRDEARKFCADRLMTRVRDAFRNETFDRAVMREMGEMGLLGVTLPEAYGGSGQSYVAYGLVAREVERVD
ncbi:MAG TPA: acyl-CoA dehydrogenase family protein, partial [Hyphomicrobiaceae bacterium]|nr:acyl-CoA dehydrogenase family protein [Hyphomicrobiaceae bacterium]